MASGTHGPSGLDATSSLEVALDQAIARRFSGASEHGSKKRRNTPVQNFAVVAPEQAHTPTDKLAGNGSTALAVPSRETALMRPPARLRWKGIEVTDEFQAYAARVASGEQLEPYRGAVLSRPCPEFPWNDSRERQTLLPPAHASQRPTLAPVSVSLFEPHAAEPTLFLKQPSVFLEQPTVYPERGRSLKTALWVAGALSSIVGALGVGAGATNAANDELYELAPDPAKLEQKPAAAAAGEAGAAARLDDVTQQPVTQETVTQETVAQHDGPLLDGSIGERQLASLAADNESAVPNDRAAPVSPPVRGETQRPSTAAIALRTQPVPGAKGSAPSTPVGALLASPLRPTILPSAAAPAAPSRGIVTMARPVEPQGGPASSRDSALFSDHAPF